jgi:hypothetical protein
MVRMIFCLRQFRFEDWRLARGGKSPLSYSPPDLTAMAEHWGCGGFPHLCGSYLCGYLNSS